MKQPAILRRKPICHPYQHIVNMDPFSKTMFFTTNSNIRSVMNTVNRVIVLQPAAIVSDTDQIKQEEVETLVDNGENAYQCDSCDELFPDRSTLIIHKTEKSILRTRVALREPLVKYTCEMCNRSFVSKGMYERHYKICGFVEVDDQPATGCRRRVRTRLEPKKLNENGEEEPSMCQKCGKIFKKAKYLKVHMTTAHGEHIVCQICDAKCDTMALLKAHMNEEHSGDYTEHCQICNKGFYLRQSLKVHMAAHLRDDNPSTCEQCGKNFRHEVYLKKHIQLVHVDVPERKRFCCEECDYETSHKTCFREHMYKHTGEDIIGCEVCGKQMRRSYLRIHSRIHTGEKPEICEFCGKAFSARKYLTKHRITHTGEKPYECQKCGKKYTQRGTLTMHFRRHHPEEASTWIAKGPGRRPHFEKNKERDKEVKRGMVISEDGMIVEAKEEHEGDGDEEEAKELIDEEEARDLVEEEEAKEMVNEEKEEAKEMINEVKEEAKEIEEEETEEVLDEEEEEANEMVDEEEEEEAKEMVDEEEEETKEVVDEEMEEVNEEEEEAFADEEGEIIIREVDIDEQEVVGEEEVQNEEEGEENLEQELEEEEEA